uniref:Phenylalanine zipper domain-containing protein n=1 Tax=Romanomermis culicivorax TaxID=13658 RepID=A0A915J8U7_ROMCU
MEPSPRTMIGVELIQNVYNGHDRRELPQNDTIPISSAAVDSGISLRSADQHARDQQAESSQAGFFVRSTTVPWTQFCDDCAKFAAYDFAQSWFNYLADNVVNLASSPAEFDVDEKLVALKFCRSFVGYFESEARRICRSSRLLNETSAFCSATVNTIVTSRHDRVAIGNAFVNRLAMCHQFVNGDINENDDNNNRTISLLVSDTESDVVSFANGGADFVDDNRLHLNNDDPSSSLRRRNDPAASSTTNVSSSVVSNRKGFSRRRNFFQKLSLKNVKRTFFRHRSSEHDIVDINHRSSAENGDQTSISDNNTNNVRVRSTTTTTTIVRRNPSGGNGNAPSSTKSSRKTVVEVVKDGTVNFVSGKDLDGKKWEKGRLCLIKTAGGYLLEFYSPPKFWLFGNFNSFHSYPAFVELFNLKGSLLRVVPAFKMAKKA